MFRQIETSSGVLLTSDSAVIPAREHHLQGAGKLHLGVATLGCPFTKDHGQLQVWAGNAENGKVLAGMLFSTLRCLKDIFTLNSQLSRG